jgi:tRNA nucleotidyltransferase (CCA-adding enzyme)
MNPTIDYLNDFFPVDRHNRIFLVGGAVRDMLMVRQRTDLDLAAALSPAEFTALGFRLVEGRSTLPVWLRHDDQFGTMEATPLEDSADLTADLLRRDFCCNAMAMTMTGGIIDPLGGRSDLELRTLRVCSHHSFSDDPLRIFRAFRFTAGGWSMDPDTEELVRHGEWSTALSALPVERFSREMLKALASQYPERFFQQMLEFGIGRELLPELFRMSPVPAGPLEHHPEGDLFSHSIQILQRVAAMSPDPLTRFCALFHDIGKLATKPTIYPRHHGHNETGSPMAIEFCRRLRLPAAHGTALAWVSRLHGTFNLWDSLRDSTKIRTATQAVKAGIVEILPLVSAADKDTSGEPSEWREALRCTGMSAGELGIELQMLEGMQPSKRGDYIMQKRVEAFRATRTSCA